MPIDTKTRPTEAVNDPALPKILETLEDEIREACIERLAARRTPFPSASLVFYINTPCERTV